MRHTFDNRAVIGIAKGIAKVSGVGTEVVIHDLESKKIIAIENAHVTGRSVGDCLNETTYDAIREISDEDGHLIAYGSHSKAGKILRSSHFIIRDDRGIPALLLCINQDVSSYKRVRDEIDALLQTNSLVESHLPEEGPQSYIQQLVTRIIHEEIERAKPFALESKEAKMEVIKKLDRRGVFDVRDAVPKVCELLGISQATLYNYQRELRQQELRYSSYREETDKIVEK